MELANARPNEILDMPMLPTVIYSYNEGVDVDVDRSPLSNIHGGILPIL
jgi:hypothetical protein